MWLGLRFDLINWLVAGTALETDGEEQFERWDRKRCACMNVKAESWGAPSEISIVSQLKLALPKDIFIRLASWQGRSQAKRNFQTHLAYAWNHIERHLWTLCFSLNQNTAFQTVVPAKEGHKEDRVKTTPASVCLAAWPLGRVCASCACVCSCLFWVVVVVFVVFCSLLFGCLSWLFSPFLRSPLLTL